MRAFSDTTGREWIAGAVEEDTTRHHGRWYLRFRPAESDHNVEFPLPEIRWQNSDTARRTILTMSETELRRRLALALARAPHAAAAVATAAV